jgi:ERF superfamily
MKTSEGLDALSAALAKAQGELTHAKKDSDNPFFKSHYADLAACIDVARDPLARNGLAIIQAPSLIEGGFVRMTTRLLHSSGQWIESELDALPKDIGPQSVGSVCTYLRRYALCAMIGLAAEDDDANAGQGVQQPKAAAKTSKREQVKAAKISNYEAAEKKNDLNGAKPVDDRTQPVKEAHGKYSEAMTRILTWHGTPAQWAIFKDRVFSGLVKMEGDGDVTAEQASALEKAMAARDKDFPQPKEETAAA